MQQYDLIIIGGGIVGCLTARYLSRYQLRILLLEKEADIGMGASGANSAIVHAGYDALPGTLKAEMNVRANPLWDTLASELGFAFDRRGDYVVAIGPTELPALDKLLDQGRRNGVPGLHIISASEMRLREPNINPQVSGALWAPTGGICDAFMVTVAAAENAVQNGVSLQLNTRFEDFVIEQDRIVAVRTARGTVGCRWVVNAAGLHADQVMHLAGVRPEFVITPRRGEYSVIDRAEIQVHNVLFPVPSAQGKGILVTATTHGNALVGPNSQFVDDKEDRATTADGNREIWEGARKIIPDLSPRAVISAFAGLRACGNAACQRAGVEYQQDFIIENPARPAGLVNLGGIESPGLTSAPAIALRVVELLRAAGERLEEKRSWNPIRPPRPRFRSLPRAEQIKLIRADRRYANILCRCETVTEGEIIAEINAPIPAVTYDALKRRTYLGTGRCQGSFDLPRVVELLACQLDIPPEEVSKQGVGSQFLVRRTKPAGEG